MKLWKAHKPSEKGANLVEMALILFVLVLFIIGIADFGRAFNNYIIITNAAREGVRYASHFPAAETAIKTITIQEAENSGVILVEDDITIAQGLNGVAGEPIRVEIDYTFDTIFAGMVGFHSLTLHSATEMVIYGLD